MKVLHHDDMDGKAAANCVYQQFRNQLKLEDFFEMSYTTKFPIKECMSSAFAKSIHKG